MSANTDCLSFILTFTCSPLNVASAFGLPLNRSTARSQPLMTADWLSHLVTYQLLPANKPINTVSAPGTPPFDRPMINLLPGLQLSSSLITTQWLATLAQLLFRSMSKHVLLHGFQVYIIVVSMYFSKYSLFWFPSVSLNLLKYALQVETIMVSKCISKVTQSQCPNSHHHGLKVHLYTPFAMDPECILEYAWLPPSNKSLNPLDQVLRVHTTLGSHCIMKLACLPPSSSSVKSHDEGLHVHLFRSVDCQHLVHL